MAARLEFTTSARRDKERLPAQDIPRLETALAAIAADPLAGKALQGEFAGLRSFCFRHYLVVYEFRPKGARIIAPRTGQRREAYR